MVQDHGQSLSRGLAERGVRLLFPSLSEFLPCRLCGAGVRPLCEQVFLERWGQMRQSQERSSTARASCTPWCS